MEKSKTLFGRYPVLGEMFRFCIVGGLATIVDFFVMGVILYLFEPSLYPNFFNVFIGEASSSPVANMVGTGLGFFAGLLVNYALSIGFVFICKGNSKTALGFLEFSLLSAFGLGLHELGMYLLNARCGMNEWIVKILTTAIVLVYNYISRKLVIFKEKREKTKEKTNEEN